MAQAEQEKRKQAKPAGEDLHPLRHSAAHVLAQAVRRLYPFARLGIGPPIEEGFYYDLEIPEPVGEADLARIEAEMKRIIEADFPFERSEISKEEARRLFREEPYKRQIIEGIPGETVSIYKDGDFTDLCEGPHLPSTGKIRAFKLLSVAGAYWRGSERNPMLTRIYGTAFFDPKRLREFLRLREEAKRRDHRKLGTQLKLFSIWETAGAGLVFYRPRGAVLREIVEQYARQQHAARGYQPVATPHLVRSTVWSRSGHTEHYRQNMFLFENGAQGWGLKPMNCPGHMLIYEADLHSYRELPIRLFELGTVYRNEKSGVLHGLLRVRGFTQDDAHIFCRRSQIEAELGGVLDFIERAMKDFGFEEYRVELSTRPPEFLGNEGQWAQAETILRRVLEKRRVDFTLSPGAGAFYGPKIDVHVKDCLGRDWQCATAQLDFVLPERFGLKYVEEDGKETRPVMIHRAIFGSLERFLGMLIEHHGGAFPLWLSPIQARVIPVTQADEAYARQVREALAAAGLRADLDDRRQTLQARIRDAELEKLPYMLIVGKREAEAGTVSVRARGKGNAGVPALSDFVETARRAVRQKQ